VALLTAIPVRHLTASDLGIPLEVSGNDERTPSIPGMSIDEAAERDAVYSAVKNALADGFGGVVLVGPPGTGKSLYAQRIGTTLAGDAHRVRFTQFHPSYQYEDFIEGWTPNKAGGFEKEDKHFLIACTRATADPDHTYVIIIDELSRCDAARVFGEALTYLEMSKRGQPFHLPSGREMVVPRNLFIIATMNPWDRGVDEVDTALLRRFAQILMPPNITSLEEILTTNGIEPNVIAAVAGFMQVILGMADDRLHIGHAYFANIRSNEALLRLWDFQLKPLFKQVTRSDTEAFKRVEGHWNRLVVEELARPVEPPPDTDAGTA